MDDDNGSAAVEGRRSSDTNSDSDRVLVTKRAIVFALRDLMAERDFGGITASDVMKRAGVSRSTFYRCFADKYDVVNWAYQRFKNIRVQDSDQYYSFETSLRSQLAYLQENQAFFVAALRYKGQNSLREHIVRVNEEYMLECWHEAHGPGQVPYAAQAGVQFAAAGCAHVIVEWLVEGCVQPADEVVAAVCRSIPAPVFETLY